MTVLAGGCFKPLCYGALAAETVIRIKTAAAMMISSARTSGQELR
jgi:hypothetical protein